MPRFAIAVLCVLPTFAQSLEQAVRNALDDQVAAWNRGDIHAFMESYEDSPATTFVSTSVIKGRDRVLQRYRDRYGSRKKMGVLRFSDLEIGMLGKDHASVLGRFHLTRDAEGGGNATGLFTLLFRRTAKGWKIILDHTS